VKLTENNWQKHHYTEVMDGSSMDDRQNGPAYYWVSLQTPQAFANQPDLMVTWNKLSHGYHSQHQYDQNGYTTGKRMQHSRPTLQKKAHHSSWISERAWSTGLFSMISVNYYMGYVVAQVVEALCHKPEGRGFVSRWCHWNFSST
jgi:hypothetical protein